MADKAAGIPGTTAHETRLLHEAMQDARTLAKELREAAAEHRRSAEDARKARAELDQMVIQINEEVSAAPETMKLKLGPVVDGITERLLDAGDVVKEALEEKWQELLDHETKILGFTDRAELVDMIARKIVLEVVASAKRIQKSRDQETQAIQGLVGKLPDLAAVLDLEKLNPPVPPAARNRRGNTKGHSRNQHRRRR